MYWCMSFIKNKAPIHCDCLHSRALTSCMHFWCLGVKNNILLGLFCNDKVIFFNFMQNGLYQGSYWKYILTKAIRFIHILLYHKGLSQKPCRIFYTIDFIDKKFLYGCFLQYCAVCAVQNCIVFFFILRSVRS